jgi:AAA+ superfamily predicted ATPase
MADGVTTQHVVIDLKTGYAYGIRLDSDGNCKAVQPLATVIEKMDGNEVTRFSPLEGFPMQLMPYGQTISAVEVTGDKLGQMFTMVWPTKAAFDKGARPEITRKDLPQDLIKAGIAPGPKTAKGKALGPDSEESLKLALKNIDTMIGLDTAKHDIKQNIALARFNQAKEEMGLTTKPISRHMVFTGNPGTGKTTFAREVAKVYHALGFIEKPVVVEVKREDLVAGYVGQTALKTKEMIDKAKGGILFIDEAYALSRGGSGDDGKDFGREAIDTLVAAMENMREDLIVIVAGYPEPMKRFIDANEGLKSRFSTYISFEDYNMMQLGQILDVMLKERGYTMEPAAREHAIKLLETEKNRAQKDFGNGRTVRNLVEKAEKELAERLEREAKLGPNHGGLSKEDFKRALTTITMGDMSAVSLTGLDAIKKGYKPIGFGETIPTPPAGNTPSNDIAPNISDAANMQFRRPPANDMVLPSGKDMVIHPAAHTGFLHSARSAFRLH